MTAIDRVAVITITFNPDLELLRLQLSATRGCGIRVLVDNGSDALVLDKLREEADVIANLELIELESNKGIAFAQNVGADFVEKEFTLIDHLLFLDHDTVPSHFAVAKLILKALQLQSMYPEFGAIGPKLVNSKTMEGYGFQLTKFGWPVRRRRGGAAINVDLLNSSGTLIPISVWRRVGGFNKDFFIDHVETDWCFRLKSLGLSLFGYGGAVMYHEMGDDVANYWLFGKRNTPQRSPLRHYYIFRNSIFLQQKPYVPLNWKALNIVKLLLTMFFFSVYRKGERGLQFKMMIKGLQDGFARRKGEAQGSLTIR